MGHSLRVRAADPDLDWPWLPPSGIALDDLSTGQSVAQAATRVVALCGLARKGSLIVELWQNGELLAWVEPAPESLVLSQPGPVSGAFASHVVVRPSGGHWVAEAPDSPGQMWLASSVLPLLAEGRSPELCWLARGAGVWVSEVREDGRGWWEWPDAWFEAAGRRPRVFRRRGATWPGREDESPAAREPWPGPLTPWPQSDGLQPISLERAMLRRRSVRAWSSAAPTYAQLAGWLRMVWAAETGRRTWPSGGARYPLEAYLAVDHCGGLSRGLFHVDQARQGLVQVHGEGPALDALLSRARPWTDAPPVVLVLAARFRRMSAKYEGISQRLILLEAGALMQNLQLAAPSHGLSTCLVGSGDVEGFARCTGLSPWLEGSVAELAIGCE